ncbi:hypothetical protein ACHAWO_011964 [Cyclotella atomus]|uniref:Uncharacterized protein n=1 Tax=Cyclotella atomus TaxID=382360 RepID=A0ABD3PBW2_9STRA
MSRKRYSRGLSKANESNSDISESPFLALDLGGMTYRSFIEVAVSFSLSSTRVPTRTSPFSVHFGISSVGRAT